MAAHSTMAAAQTAEVMKQLSFEDVSLHMPAFVQVHDVLQAVAEPSVESFEK